MTFACQQIITDNKKKNIGTLIFFIFLYYHTVRWGPKRDKLIFKFCFNRRITFFTKPNLLFLPYWDARWGLAHSSSWFCCVSPAFPAFFFFISAMVFWLGLWNEQKRRRSESNYLVKNWVSFCHNKTKVKKIGKNFILINTKSHWKFPMMVSSGRQ